MIAGFSLLSVRPAAIGGLAAYAESLAVAMSTAFGEKVLFFCPPDAVGFWSSRIHESQLVPTGPPTSSRRGIRVLFETVVLGRVAANLGCGQLFFPNTAYPLAHRIPSTVTIHDAMYRNPGHSIERHRRIYFDACYSALRTRDDIRIVTISRFARMDISNRLGIPAARILVIQSGVHESFFVEGDQPAASISPPSNFMLSVGACYAHKRLPLVVDAFEHVAQHGGWPDLALVMVGTTHGDAPERRRVIERIGESPVKERIYLYPPITWSELHYLYRRASALLHSSEYEGFGLPIAEAMAAGLPVVASPSGAVVEVLGGFGYLARDMTSEALASMALEVSRQQQRTRGRARLHAARDFARVHYRWSRAASELGCLLGING